MKRFTILSTAVIVGLSLAGCGQKSSEEHFQAAQVFLADDQLNSAVIELKSALQKDPERAEYRLALADVYSKAGLLDDAVKEYQRAFEYSTDHQSFIQRYTSTLYLNGNHSDILQIVDNIDNYPQPLRDYLLFYKALAEAELGSNENATTLFTELSTSDQADISNFASAFLTLAKNEFNEAKQLLTNIESTSSLYYQAIYLRSKIALTENDMVSAVTLLREYTKVHPYQLLPQLLLAQSLVKTAQLDQADELLKPLLKKVPQQPLANYFAAVLAYENKQFEQARIYIDTAIANGFSSPQARILAALVAVNLKLDNIALNHLDVAKDALHIYPPAQRLYAVLMLKTGNTDVARQFLSEKELQNTDIQLLSATAFELTKQGSVEAAQNLLEQYKTNKPLSANELATLGAVQLQMTGQRSTAIRSLEQALQLDPATDQARIMLLSAYISQQQYSKAMALADEWIANEQRKTAGHNMKAYVALVSEQLDVAAENIGIVLQTEPKNSLGRLLNASLLAAQGNLIESGKLFQALLDDEPENVQALEQYLALSRGKGDTTDVLQRARKAHQAKPDDANLTLLLASIEHSSGDYKTTLGLLNNIDGDSRDRSPKHWAYLIDTQLREKSFAQALQSAEEWYNIQPNSHIAAQAYMQTLYVNKDIPAAIKIVDKLLAAQPEHIRFINIKLQMLDEASMNQPLLDYAKSLPVAVQQRPEVLLVRGKALARLKQYGEAEQLLTQSYAKQPQVNTVIFLGELYSRVNKTAEGIALLERHIATHGNNTAAQTMLAQLSLSTDAERAVKAYQTILNDQPDNVLALNNLAWLMLEKDNVTDALVHAEKAYQLRPDNADVLDTYGKVLLNNNNIEKAKTILEAALKARPEDAQVQLHYAEALVRSGNNEKAKAILQQVEQNQEFTDKVAAFKAMYKL